MKMQTVSSWIWTRVVSISNEGLIATNIIWKKKKKIEMFKKKFFKWINSFKNLFVKQAYVCSYALFLKSFFIYS